ncbi:lamin tail domain-containing protein, partial [bacterium]|nr:lamin tail domain-containing protein [bacterium]
EHDRTPDGPKSYEQVNITITAKDAFANLTSVVINVNYNGGIYSEAEMTAGANNQYSYTIQPTNDGTTVRYYFDFVDDDGQTAQRWWAGSTNEPYLYIVNDNPVLSGMVINEIMYNSSNIWVENATTTSNYEYVEIYNFNTQAVDVSHWQFHDDANKYRLPDSLTAPADGYIILADKTQAVIDVYGAIPANALLISIPELGLANSGEIISWQTANGEKLNELTYDDKAPWPIEPDGNGPSLELINWTFDNILPGSWLSSTNFGTPGKENSVFVPEGGIWIIGFLNFWIIGRKFISRK